MSDEKQPTERKVTFGEIFGIAEYRAIYSSTQLSWIGEYMAKAAVMALVFAQTQSVLLSAASFALSYAPWLIGGPFLSALAERYRYKRVMISCDLLRAGLIALVAVPGLPLPVMLLLVFMVALLAPPGQAARSATLPLVLTGERVVLGLAVNQSSGQATQVVGYFTGSVVSIIDPRVALLCNAGTFLLSAVILWHGLRDRPPAMRPEDRSHLLRETSEGFRMVFGTPALRVIAIIVFTSMLFAIVPEGLAVGWASELAGGEQTRQGFYQGAIMVAHPLGFAIGVLLIARLLLPITRRRLVPILAVLGPLALVPAIGNPQVAGVVVMTVVSGVAMAGMTPTLNGLFVQALPNGFRARAFGVMNSGIQAIQGIAIITTGVLVSIAGNNQLHLVVGIWSLAGVAVMLALALRWPKPDFFAAAIAKAEAANDRAEATPDRPEAANDRAEATHDRAEATPDRPGAAHRLADGRAANNGQPEPPPPGRAGVGRHRAADRPAPVPGTMEG